MGFDVFHDKGGVGHNPVFGDFRGRDIVRRFPGNPPFPFHPLIFQKRFDHGQIGAGSDRDLGRDHQIDRAEPVIHLRRPARLDMNFLVGTDQLRGNVALPDQHLPASPGQKVGLGCLAMPRQAGIAEIPEQPMALEEPELVGGGGAVQSRRSSELVGRQEAVALDEEQPQGGLVGERESLAAGHVFGRR